MKDLMVLVGKEGGCRGHKTPIDGGEASYMNPTGADEP